MFSATIAGCDVLDVLAAVVGEVGRALGRVARQLDVRREPLPDPLVEVLDRGGADDPLAGDRQEHRVHRVGPDHGVELLGIERGEPGAPRGRELVGRVQDPLAAAARDQPDHSGSFYKAEHAGEHTARG